MLLLLSLLPPGFVGSMVAFDIKYFGYIHVLEKVSH